MFVFHWCEMTNVCVVDDRNIWIAPLVLLNLKRDRLIVANLSSLTCGVLQLARCSHGSSRHDDIVVYMQGDSEHFYHRAAVFTSLNNSRNVFSSVDSEKEFRPRGRVCAKKTT